jgi:uncharacterized protein YdaU (DUF1376 family)
MKKPECFLFNVKDWLSSLSVEAMSGDQVKAYVYLLCRAWDNEQIGTLPNDQAVLARLARVSPDTWDAIKGPILAQFQSDETGSLFNERLLQEARHWQMRVAAGRTGWNSKRLKQQAKRIPKRDTKQATKQNTKHITERV